MFRSFDKRSHELERLDTGDYTSAEYTRWQREMRFINRFLGDTRALRIALRDELGDCPDGPVSILDVGAGSGELLYAAGQIAGRQTFLAGADLNAEAASSMAARREEIGVHPVQCDALELPFADDSFDFVISSLFLHHLTNEQAVRLLREMGRVSRCRFFIIDLHRHAAAYYLYQTFGRTALQRFTIEDGSLSIKRSFRPEELRNLAERAGIQDAIVKRRAAFRLVLSGSKNRSSDRGRPARESTPGRAARGPVEYDVAIVGAGPAGSSAAIRLAQNGLRVVLVEQKKFPREKLCGEFISPECLAHFAELGVLDEMTLAGGTMLERTVFYARNGRSVTVPSEWFGGGSFALGLSRAEMDDRLLKRARSSGVKVLEETQAIGVLTENETVRGVRLRNLSGNGLEIRARLTLDATGRARILSRQIEKVKRERARFIAFKTHLENAAIPPADCEIYAYRGGYGGCSAIEGGQFNLCFIVPREAAKKYSGDAERIMRSMLFTNKHAKRSLEKACIVDDWLAVPIESYGRNKLVPAPGLLAVGDASAFIDPFTGSGILLALETSRIATGVVTDYLNHDGGQHAFVRLADEYNRQYAASLNHRLRICSFLRRMAFVPSLAEVVIRALALSDDLTYRVARCQPENRRPAGANRFRVSSFRKLDRQRAGAPA